VARTGRPFSPAAGARAGRGLLAWQVPRRRDRALGDGRASATFEVDTRPLGGGHADRGLVDDVRAFVLRFTAPIITGAAIELLEAGVDKGLVQVTSSDPKSWVRVRSLSEVRLPAGGAPRILLFVHGTFSSTVGGFGSLTTDAGTEFLERAIEAYDAVIGFDHLWTLDQHKARSMIDLPSASGRDLVRLKAILDGIKGGPRYTRIGRRRLQTRVVTPVEPAALQGDDTCRRSHCRRHAGCAGGRLDAVGFIESAGR
jgi:hypothetical protein